MIRLVRALAAWMLPRDLRRRFGAQIELDLEETWRRETAGRGVGTRLIVAVRLALDILRNSLDRSGRARVGGAQRRAALPIWRWALRALLRRPLFSAIVVGTLALTVGAAVAVFGIVHAEVLRPLPYAEADRLVVVGQRYGDFMGNLSALDLRDLRAQAASFAAVTGFDDRKVLILTGAGDPLRVTAAAVDTEFFRVLGTPALIGRTLGPADDRADGGPSVVISERLWRRSLGGDPAILDRDLILDGRPHAVVGVMPAEFQIPDEEELWVPHGTFPYGDDRRGRRDLGYLEVVARLAPGVDLERATGELDLVARRLSAARPEPEPIELAMRELEEELAGPAAGILHVLVAAVVALLLIAAVDLAGLVTTRMAERRPELAVRRALGAGRAQLAAQLLCEGLVLAAIGGTFGIALGVWLLAALPRMLPGWFPRLSVVGVEPPVALFGIVLIAVLGGLLGLLGLFPTLPALPALRSSAPGSRTRGRLRQLSVTTQIAVAFAVLVAAGLLVRSFDRLVRVPVGFRTQGVLTAQIALPAAAPGSTDPVGFFADLVERLAAEPGVEAAGAVNRLPLSEGTTTTELEIAGRSFEEPPAAHLRSATPGYLRALGITVIAGRDLEPSDHADAEPVALVDETLAERYWGAEGALDARLRTSDDQPWRRVVGVVAGTRHWGQAFGPTPTIYLPHAQAPGPTMMVALATPGDPGALAGPLRSAVRDLDPGVPVHQIRTLRQALADSVALRRVSMAVFLFFSAIGLLLAALGVYGAVASLVAARRREIGIRMAVGARARQIVRGIVGRVTVLILAALAAGSLLSWWSMRWLESLLFGVEPLDPTTLGAVGLFVVVVALVAAAGPARRAATIDPARTLRDE